MNQELSFLKYRLEVAREMPEGPYKAAILRAIQLRLQALNALSRMRR